MPEIDLESAITTNVLRLGELTLEAHADRMIITGLPNTLVLRRR
jgi:hypothetical protein